MKFVSSSSQIAFELIICKLDFFFNANGVYVFRIIGDCTYTEHSFIAWLVNKLMSLRPEWQSEVNSAVKTHSYQT